MSIYKELNRNPTTKDVRSFSAIFLGGMVVAGGIIYYQNKPDIAQVLWIIGAVVMVLAQIQPLGRLLYILWMGLGLTIGLFTAPLIMFVVYTVVIVPVGLVFKLTKRDTMRREIDPKVKTYWENYPVADDPASYIRQF